MYMKTCPVSRSQMLTDSRSHSFLYMWVLAEARLQNLVP